MAPKNILSFTIRQTEQFKQGLKPIVFVRIQAQNTNSVSHVSLRILCSQGVQDFSAPPSLTLLELQIYIGWRYTRWDETELLNQVIDSLP